MTDVEADAREALEGFLREASGREEWFAKRQNPEAVFPDDVLNLAGAEMVVQSFSAWSVCPTRLGLCRPVEVSNLAEALALLSFVRALTAGESVELDLGLGTSGAPERSTVELVLSGSSRWGVPVRTVELIARIEEALGDRLDESSAEQDAVESFLHEYSWRPAPGGVEREFRLPTRHAARELAGRILSVVQFHPQQPRCVVQVEGHSVMVGLFAREQDRVSEGVLDVAVEAERLLVAQASGGELAAAEGIGVAP